MNPPNNDTQAPLLLGLGGSLLTICILLLCARFWSRRHNLRADDWAVLLGTVRLLSLQHLQPTNICNQLLAITNFVIQCIACTHGFGRRTRYTSASERRATLELIFIHQVLWYWSITLVKLSVALLLLRLKSSRRWNLFLYGIITLLILTVITQTLFQFLQCRPFNVYWDPSVALEPDGVKCIGREAIDANIIANSTIHVATDMVFSLAPMTFIIRKLHRPRGEKVFLSILMGLGLFASTFAILRTVGLSTFYSAGNDFFRGNVMPTLWSTLEVEVALIAATAPTLRSFLHRVLVRLGGYFYEEESETQIRGRLVELGFLVEEEAYGKGECWAVERKPSKPDIDVGTSGSWSSGKRKDNFGDTVVEEKEVIMIAVTVP
jgi:hypothetical protein